MKNHIFPFLWMRGESDEVIREEMDRIDYCGIKAVCVEARPHDDYCGPDWWRDLGIVLEEAEKRQMKVWILDDKHFPTGFANGLIKDKYPDRKKQYINCSTADVFGKSRLMTLDINRMLKPSIGFWQIGDAVDYDERLNNEVVAIVALRFDEDNIFHEDTIDLTELYTVDNPVIRFQLPEGAWRVHLIYKTRTDGGDDTYINMIDEISASTQIEAVYEPHFGQFKEKFGTTIAGFFSDEPQFGNIFEQCFDTKVGHKKMSLPWSEELKKLLVEAYGDSFTEKLVYLFASTKERILEPQVRYDYMDFISRLYAKNFAQPIGHWCEEHGVEYIGHVVEDNSVHSRLGLGAAHYFRAISGQHMAGIDCIGGQVVYGAGRQTHGGMSDSDGEFFHYTLGKLGASSGHLEPKKKGRTMCELFGAYGWNFGVRDMKYVLDHLLVRGVNELVPHAFSMANYPDSDCPPHFYARGHNGQFDYFADLMRYGNRMCDLLSDGQHVASVAVLYDGELDWSGERMPMQKICRQLIEHQVEFDIVSLDMLTNLADYNGTIQDNALVINGIAFKMLLVPSAEYMPQALLDFVEQHPAFPVIVVGDKPLNVLPVTAHSYEKLDLFTYQNLEGLGESIQKQGLSRVSLEKPFADLTVYHYDKNGNIFALLNESSTAVFSGNITFKGSEELIAYDVYADKKYAVSGQIIGSDYCVSLNLEPGQAIVLLENFNQEIYPIYQSYQEKRQAKTTEQVLTGDWTVKLMKAKTYPTVEEEFETSVLSPISDCYPDFAGIIRYELDFRTDDLKNVLLEMEHVHEVVTVEIDGVRVGRVITAPYAVDLEQLSAGDHHMAIEVATTPVRDQANYPQPPFDFSYEGQEATGFWGKVSLRY